MPRHMVPTSPGSSKFTSNSQAAAALATYEVVTKLKESAHRFWENHFAYTVTVAETEDIYTAVQNWLMQSSGGSKIRSLAAVDSNRSNMASSDSDSSDKPTIRFFSDSDISRTVSVDGSPVRVQLHKAETSEEGRAKGANKIVFTSTTQTAQDAVIALIHRLGEDRKKAPALRLVNVWGNWVYRSDIPTRTLDTVVLPADQKQRIVSDMEQFLAAEADYNAIGVPWHRGYLLHGKPGTGKTSLIRALASHYKLNLWYISLSDLTGESSLMNLISEVGPRSILLLEDVDRIKLTHERTDVDAGKMSLSSLLNALDGVATPHGLITMMTTNDRSLLDPALVRAGRMDVVEELGYLTPEVLRQMFISFYNVDINVDIDEEDLIEVSPAEVIEIFKNNMGTWQGAASTIVQIYGGKLVKNYRKDGYRP